MWGEKHAAVRGKSDVKKKTVNLIVLLILPLSLAGSVAALQGAFAVGTQPFGVAFDGANMWVVNQNDNNVVKIPVFP
jgi:DNA-binding beta-propeller fold protein YncE